jgi:hypothetical protein
VLFMFMPKMPAIMAPRAAANDPIDSINSSRFTSYLQGCDKHQDDDDDDDDDYGDDYGDNDDNDDTKMTQPLSHISNTSVTSEDPRHSCEPSYYFPVRQPQVLSFLISANLLPTVAAHLLALRLTPMLSSRSRAPSSSRSASL